MSQKRKVSSIDGGSSNGNKNKSKNVKLFQTLATLQQIDNRATKRRKQSQLTSLQQSKAANDQSKLSAIFLELRILIQRSFTNVDQIEQLLEDGLLGDIEGGSKDKKSSPCAANAVEEEVDSLLENLLMARRNLFSHRLHDSDAPEESHDGEEDNESRSRGKGRGSSHANFYAELISKEVKKRALDNKELNDDLSEGDIDENSASSDTSGSTSDSSSSATENSTGKTNNDDPSTLTQTLQNEYENLRSHWKAVLNRHHLNLQLHSGMMSSSASKFLGGGSNFKAVDVSFWEQVIGSMEHDKFRSSRNNTKARDSDDNGEGTNGKRILEKGAKSDLTFDDSKLYQQMLKDFISTSNSEGSNTSGLSNKRKAGSGMDPAEEAAERLKRAMRKKSGMGDNAVDLSLSLHSLLTSSSTNAAGASSAVSGIKNGSKKSTVDRRASKGRKIRYVVHPKLVNFTFPIARPEPMIPEDVWFRSLFGGVGNRNR